MIQLDLDWRARSHLSHQKNGFLITLALKIVGTLKGRIGRVIPAQPNLAGGAKTFERKCNARLPVKLTFI